MGRRGLTVYENKKILGGNIAAEGRSISMRFDAGLRGLQ
jgi:hypothetical protein